MRIIAEKRESDGTDSEKRNRADSRRKAGAGFGARAEFRQRIGAGSYKSAKRKGCGVQPFSSVLIRSDLIRSLMP